MLVQAMMENRSMLVPAHCDDWSAREMAAFDNEQRAVLRTFDLMMDEFLSIKVALGADGAPKMARGGFRIFRAEGRKKKDLAYAALYSLAALLSCLMDPENDPAAHGADEGLMAGAND
jgi:hypothetical protein